MKHQWPAFPFLLLLLLFSLSFLFFASILSSPIGALRMPASTYHDASLVLPQRYKGGAQDCYHGMAEDGLALSEVQSLQHAPSWLHVRKCLSTPVIRSSIHLIKAPGAQVRHPPCTSIDCAFCLTSSRDPRFQNCYLTCEPSQYTLLSGT